MEEENNTIVGQSKIENEVRWEGKERKNIWVWSLLATKCYSSWILFDSLFAR